MSETVKGVVEVISNRGKAYNIKVDGNWYGFGFESPGFEEGTVVEFEVKANGKWKNVDNDTLKVLGKSTAPAPKADNKSSGSTGGSREDYWSKKEERDVVVQRQICYQAARNSALTFLEVLLSAECLRLPAKVADRAEVMEGALKHYTEVFAEATFDYGAEPDVPDDALSAEDKEEAGDYE